MNAKHVDGGGVCCGATGTAVYCPNTGEREVNADGGRLPMDDDTRLAADNERLMLTAVCAATPALPTVKGYCQDCTHWIDCEEITLGQESVPGHDCEVLGNHPSADWYCAAFRPQEAPDVTT